MSPRLRRRLAPAALIWIGFALRIHRLGQADIWWDEGLAVWAVKKTFGQATAWTAGDVHPPLFFWLLWPWIRLVGDSEFAVRLLPALTGTLLLVVTLALAARIGGRRAGLFALALAALARYTIWWSMELRMYALAGLCLALAAYAAVRWWTHSDTSDELEAAASHGTQSSPLSPLPWLALYVAAALGTMMTVYLAGVGLVFIALPPLVVLVWHRRWKPARSWLAAQVIALIGFAPWAWYASERMPSWRIIEAAPSISFVSDLWATLMATGISTDLGAVRNGTVLFWLAALLVPLEIGLVKRVLKRRKSKGSLGNNIGNSIVASEPPWWRDARSGIPLITLAAFLLLTPLVIWAITQPRSIFYSPRVEARYFLPFATLVFALFGVLLARAGRWIGPALLVVALGTSLQHLPDYYALRHRTADLPTMALAIWSQAEPGDVVLLVSGNRYPLFLYHYEREWIRALGMPEYEYPPAQPARRQDLPPVVPFPDRGSGDLDAHPGWEGQLEDLVQEHERIWLVEYGRELQDSDDEVEKWLDARLPRVLSEGYGPDALHLFSTEDRPPSATHVSSRWPGTVWMDDTQSSLGAEGQWMPVAGLPARVAAPGDEIELSLFAKDASDANRLTPRLAAQRSPNESYAIAVGRMEMVSTVTTDVPVRARLRLPVDSQTPGGGHRLVVESFSPLAVAQDAPLPARLEEGFEVRVIGSPALVETPEKVRERGKVGGWFLSSAAFSPRVLKPGGTVVLDVIWRPDAQATISEDGAYLNSSGLWERTPLTILGLSSRAEYFGEMMIRSDHFGPSGPLEFVFAHLVGDPNWVGDPVWAGNDGPPSTGWHSGHDLDASPSLEIFDRHVLELKPDAPPGEYLIEVGIYDALAGERLEVSGESDGVDVGARRIIVGVVEVVE